MNILSIPGLKEALLTLLVMTGAMRAMDPKKTTGEFNPPTTIELIGWQFEDKGPRDIDQRNQSEWGKIKVKQFNKLKAKKELINRNEFLRLSTGHLVKQTGSSSSMYKIGVPLTFYQLHECGFPMKIGSATYYEKDDDDRTAAILPDRPIEKITHPAHEIYCNYIKNGGRPFNPPLGMCFRGTSDGFSRIDAYTQSCRGVPFKAVNTKYLCQTGGLRGDWHDVDFFVWNNANRMPMYIGSATYDLTGACLNRTNGPAREWLLFGGRLQPKSITIASDEEIRNREKALIAEAQRRATTVTTLQSRL